MKKPKRSEWMRGLLDCERMVHNTSARAATTYQKHGELDDDTPEFQQGWSDYLRNRENRKEQTA